MKKTAKHTCKYEMTVGKILARLENQSRDIAEVKQDVKEILEQQHKSEGQKTILAAIIAMVVSISANVLIRIVGK